MFWHMSPLSASSPVEVILDKEDYSLEELLDEEEIIQECKALNSRLINFLRDRAQVEQLLRYIVEEAPEDAESKRAFKFPFIACEIFTCEIDVILKTLVDEEELMNLLFSFLEPKHSHSTLLAGYFSKVVVCLMVRKMAQLMNYVQAHQDVIQKLVDLIGITSIMEVLVRLVGADDHIYSNFTDVMQWLANGNLLGMIVDKLNPSNPPEVHANAAETLCAVTQNAPSALASKLSTPSFVTRIFSHVLEDSQSRSGLVHSLSVCISLMDPKRLSSPLLHSFRSQHMYESPVTVHPDTVTAMLPKLGDLLMLLDVSSDEKTLATTYGELRPPLGKHRLKIVEFFAVLLRTGSEIAEKELVCVGAIQKILDLFFGYPFHNALHHLVEGIITSCLESKNSSIVDHLFQECNLVGRILQTDKHPILSSDLNQPTVLTSGRQAPQVGNLGHITRISNKLVQLRKGNSQIQTYLQENEEWVEWEATVLQKRNALENIHHWACGRPNSLQDRARDSDEDEGQDRDYDVGTLANNLSLAFRYNIYENDDTEEVRGSLERDDEDVYFDDESAEVVISSLRLGDEHESLFTNANWFAFEDESLSSSEKISEINSNETANASSSSNDEDVVIGEADDLVENAASVDDGALGSGTGISEELTLNNAMSEGGTNSRDEKASVSGDVGFFQSDATANKNESSSSDGPLPDCVGLHETPDMQVNQSDGSSLNEIPNGRIEGDLSARMNVTDSTSNSLPNGKIDEPIDTACAMDSENGSAGTDTSASLFEEDVEFVVGEPEGVEKAMEHALKEGTVGEAGCLKKSLVPQVSEMSEEDREGMLEFNDTNYWRVDKEVVGVVQQ